MGAGLWYYKAMIGKLTGKIAEKERRSIILEVGGVGYLVYIMEDSLKDLVTGEEATLWIHMAVKEDAQDLYGFIDKEELHFFKLLVGISGIGPKTSLNILSIAPPQTLEKAIVSGNTSYLTKVSGIGRKSAEKIVLELKDKLKDVILEEDGSLEEDTDAMLALKSLGYGTKEAREALKHLPHETTGTSNRIKEALKKLGN
jgi:holliday junction DNA helicase RuvA